MRRIHLIFATLAVVATMTLAACSTSGKAASSKFCVTLKQYSKDKTLSSTNSGNVKTRIDAYNAAFTKLAALAPPAIKTDMQKTQRLMSDSADLVHAESTNATNSQELLAKQQSLRSEQADGTAAAKRVDSWAKSNCRSGFSFGS